MGKLEGKDKEIIEMYNEGFSTVQIAEKYYVKHQSINKLLRKYNVILRNRKNSLFLRFANYTKISDNCMEMMNGWLLGDGHLGYSNSGQTYFQMTSKHEEYIKYIKNILEKEKLKCYILKCFNKKQQTYYWKLNTNRTVQFKKLRDKWYFDRNKIVPQDIVLSNDAIKNWIMDDGSVDKRDGILTLNTQGFTKKGCEFLSEKLNRIISVGKISINMVKRAKYPVIKINRIATESLFNIIGKCYINCFQYKWERGGASYYV